MDNCAVVRVLLWLVLATSAVVHCAQEDCVVVAPNSVRLGAEETIVVSNQGEPKYVTLHVQDYPGRLHTFHRETMRLERDGSQLVRLRISPENFGPDYVGPAQRKYVSLSVDCGAIYRKQAKLLVSEKSGYVFLQTDKPIYTPKQQVRIRFVAVSENFVPSPGPFNLEIKNPQEIVTYRTTLEQKDNQTSTGMFSHTYTFPNSPLLGEWKVVVAYGAHYVQTTEVKFKLDEYVLPTFSVNLTVPDVILADQDRITGSVKAMYVYGKPVEGSAAFRFRIKNEANNETEVGSISPKDLSNGNADFSIPTAEFKMPRGHRWAPMVQGNRLVVEVVVMDGATSKRESAVDDSAIFANTPYIISFKSTPMDFRPGAQTIVVVDVQHLNLRPAANVRVEISIVDGQEQAVRVKTPVTSTDDNGKAIFFVETETTCTLLKCRVRTADSKYQQQAAGTLILEPYQSPPEAMLAIKRVDTRRTLTVGESFHGDVTVKPNGTYPIYYVVMSRGHVESYGTLGGEGIIQKSLHFRVNQNMAPLVRILVYAFHNGHLLADSLALEVEQVCRSDSQIDIEPHFRLEEPGSDGVINVRGTQGALVGILAVDKAVYILSNKELLTRSKMFSALRSHDIGCGPGGGLTSDVVLDNSGVVVISRHTADNEARNDRSCEARNRKRRSRLLMSQQRHQDPYLKECCALGQRRDRIGRDCTTRANIVRQFLTDERGAQCAESFLQCCTATAVLVMGALPARPGLQDPDRSRVNPNRQDLDELDMKEFDEENIPLRSNFQETWLFEEKTISDNGLAEFHASLPHSITKWRVQAVAVSPGAGVCVAQEKDIRAFRSVFLHLSLPYKVVRNEQIEVLVTVYNYGPQSLNGYVYMIGVEGLCSGAAPGRRTEKKRVQVAGNSAKSVTFPVIPLREGEFNVQVYATTTRGHDNVLKILNVVPEGVTVEKSVSVPIDPTNERRRKTRSIRGDLYQDSLDPAARVQVIAVNTRLPPDAVPDTKYCSLSIIGDKVGPSIHHTLENLENLISLPRGCGEQNMMLMAPTLYALDYLKHKGTINETIEEKAYEYVRTGYERQLTYRKEDGSFSAFRHRDSSVWLTAFVLRVFCKARFYVNIDPSVVDSGIVWLASQQKADGSFREIKPILHKTMLGGIKGTTPMTAFVLLTLHECSGKSTAQRETILRATARAENFLRQRLNGMEEPYIAALVAYSLSLGQRLGQEEAYEILKELMVYDPGLSTHSTGEDSTPLVVEGTSYALLASLRRDEVEFSKSIVNWLNTHRSATGSFTSTQDTVVALQALSEFAMKSREGFLDLTCNVTLSNKRDFKQSIRVRRDNAAILQQLELNDVSGKMFVSASGIGSGLLSVKLKYNIMVPPEMLCKFNLTVKADVHIPRATHSRQFTFPSNLLDELLGPERERRSLSVHHYRLSAPRAEKGASHWREPTWNSPLSQSSYTSDPRHRVGSGSLSSGNIWTQSHGPQASKLTYDIEVCTRYLVGGDSNMAAAEVGIFSGFEPVKEDLDKLLQEKVIDKYEISDKSVVLYFEKISTDKGTCISFRVQRLYIVTNLQAAVVKVYDYYNPMHSCSQFYGPGSTSPLLKLVCEGSQCQCAETGCPSKNPFESVLDVIRYGPRRPREQLAEITCDDHDFVWQGRVVDTTQSNGFRKIVFRVDKVVKEGTERAVDVQGYDREFITRDHCTTTDLVRGDHYVIFAQDSEPFEDNGRILRRYTLDQTARIFRYNSTSYETNQLRPIFAWLVLGFEKRGGCIE